MSSTMNQTTFGRDCAAAVARRDSPPCPMASANNKTANDVLIISLFIFVKPPATSVGQDKWRARDRRQLGPGRQARNLNFCPDDSRALSIGHSTQNHSADFLAKTNSRE